jgi:hypothetical protein
MRDKRRKTQDKTRIDKTKDGKNNKTKDQTKIRDQKQTTDNKESNPIQLWCQMTRLKHTTQKTRHQDTRGNKKTIKTI